MIDASVFRVAPRGLGWRGLSGNTSGAREEQQSIEIPGVATTHVQIMRGLFEASQARKDMP